MACRAPEGPCPRMPPLRPSSETQSTQLLLTLCAPQVAPAPAAALSVAACIVHLAWRRLGRTSHAAWREVLVVLAFRLAGAYSATCSAVLLRAASAAAAGGGTRVNWVLALLLLGFPTHLLWIARPVRVL